QLQEPRRLRQLRPEVPAALDDLVHQMLDRRPGHRPPSPLAVANALRPFVPHHSGILPAVEPRNAAPAEQLAQTVQQLEQSLAAPRGRVGDRSLEALAREHGTSLDFLGLARAIVRSHHERHAGRGYPDRLAGDAIPPAGRLVAVADVYDALRRMRLYKPALAH